MSVLSGYVYDHCEDWSDNQSVCCYCADFFDDVDCAGALEFILDCVVLK